jgi:hypothetical protein
LTVTIRIGSLGFRQSDVSEEMPAGEVLRPAGINKGVLNWNRATISVYEQLCYGYVRALFEARRHQEEGATEANLRALDNVSFR